MKWPAEVRLNSDLANLTSAKLDGCGVVAVAKSYELAGSEHGCQRKTSSDVNLKGLISCF